MTANKHEAPEPPDTLSDRFRDAIAPRTLPLLVATTADVSTAACTSCELRMPAAETKPASTKVYARTEILKCTVLDPHMAGCLQKELRHTSPDHRKAHPYPWLEPTTHG